MAGYVVDNSFTKVDLSNSSSYTNIYTYTGEGSLKSFWMTFNSDNVFVQLVVDGNQVFEIDCDELESYTTAGDEEPSPIVGFGSFHWDRDKNSLLFKPIGLVGFGSTLEINAKANSSSTTRDMQGYIVDIEKRA